MHFAEVEEVKKEGGDFTLDIDVRPNRAGDCFSHLGIGREIAAILSYKLEVPKIALKEDKKINAKDLISVRVKDISGCQRYAARVVTGVKIGPSPAHIQARLKVCGLRPINNIVDIANYVMLETGQPLHAFDLKKLEGRQIIVRFARPKEKIITIDGGEYNLNEKVLVIADAKKPVAIAGIKGGKFPEITEKTETVVLESANFNQKIVRHGSAQINLKTDASLRFEHGIDPNLAEFAVNRAASLIGEIAGGKIARGLIDFYPRKVFPSKIFLDLNYLKDFLGREIPKKEIIKILNNLEFKTKEIRKNIFEVLIPTRRLDVKLSEDLIEEIGRIYGYEKIPALPPFGAMVSPKRNENIFWQDAVKNILKEAGFSEVYNYSFLGEKEIENLGYDSGDLIEIANPLSFNQQYLRPTQILNLLKNVKENLKYFNEIKIFELGKIFNKKIKERWMVTGIISKRKKDKSAELFFEIKGVVDSLLNGLGISSILYDQYRPTPQSSKIKIWNRQRCAEIKVNEREEIGFLGEIEPTLLLDLGIEGSVAVFDVNFEKLQKIASEEQEYRPISQHPAAVRDIALLVPQDVLVDEVLGKIEIAGGKLVQDVDLFDIYEGEELPDGKKNLAFHVIFQAKDRTLKTEEINNVLEKIIETLEEEPDWEVRK